MRLKDAVKIYDECSIKSNPKWDISGCANCPLADKIKDNLFFDGNAYCDVLCEVASLLEYANNETSKVREL